jgi:hypothetical protein
VLVGAVALALIIVSGAVVVNSVLYTGNVSPSGSTGSVDEALSTQESVRADMREMVRSLSGGDPYVEESVLKNEVKDYRPMRERSAAIESPASVVVNYDDLNSVTGTFVQTKNQAKFNSISGGSGKQLVDNADRFVAFEVQVSNVKTQNKDENGGFVVTLEEDSTGDTWKLFFVAQDSDGGTDRFSAYTKTGSNSAVALSGCQNVDAGTGDLDEITTSQPVVFQQQGDRLLVRWSGGSCDASTTFAPNIDSTFDVSINILKSSAPNLPPGNYKNSIKPEGTIGFATDGTPAGSPFSSGTNKPNVVLEAAFDYQYTSPNVDYDGRIEGVEVPSTALLYSASFDGSSLLIDYGLSHTTNGGGDSEGGIRSGVRSSDVMFLGGGSGADSSSPGDDEGIIDMRPAAGVDTSAFEKVKVTFWIQEGDGSDGPEAPSSDPNEELVVSYYDASSSAWVQYNTFPATTDDGSSTARMVTFYLDEDALNSNFRLRFRQPDADADDDDWHIDDIIIEGVS